MTEIRRLRKRIGLSAKQLALIVGVSSMSIYRYEQGCRVPDLVVASKIANALGCTIEQLLGTKKGR